MSVFFLSFRTMKTMIFLLLLSAICQTLSLPRGELMSVLWTNLLIADNYSYCCLIIVWALSVMHFEVDSPEWGLSRRNLSQMSADDGWEEQIVKNCIFTNNPDSIHQMWLKRRLTRRWIWLNLGLIMDGNLLLDPDVRQNFYCMIFFSILFLNPLEWSAWWSLVIKSG